MQHSFQFLHYNDFDKEKLKVLFDDSDVSDGLMRGLVAITTLLQFHGFEKEKDYELSGDHGKDSLRRNRITIKGRENVIIALGILLDFTSKKDIFCMNEDKRRSWVSKLWSCVGAILDDGSFNIANNETLLKMIKTVLNCCYHTITSHCKLSEIDIGDTDHYSNGSSLIQHKCFKLLADLTEKYQIALVSCESRFVLFQTTKRIEAYKKYENILDLFWRLIPSKYIREKTQQEENSPYTICLGSRIELEKFEKVVSPKKAQDHDNDNNAYPG